MPPKSPKVKSPPADIQEQSGDIDMDDVSTHRRDPSPSPSSSSNDSAVTTISSGQDKASRGLISQVVQAARASRTTKAEVEQTPNSQPGTGPKRGTVKFCENKIEDLVRLVSTLTQRLSDQEQISQELRLQLDALQIKSEENEQKIDLLQQPPVVVQTAEPSNLDTQRQIANLQTDINRVEQELVKINTAPVPQPVHPAASNTDDDDTISQKIEVLQRQTEFNHQLITNLTDKTQTLNILQIRGLQPLQDSSPQDAETTTHRLLNRLGISDSLRRPIIVHRWTFDRNNRATLLLHLFNSESCQVLLNAIERRIATHFGRKAKGGKEDRMIESILVSQRVPAAWLRSVNLLRAAGATKKKNERGVNGYRLFYDSRVGRPVLTVFRNDPDDNRKSQKAYLAFLRPDDTTPTCLTQHYLMDRELGEENTVSDRNDLLWYRIPVSARQLQANKGKRKRVGRHDNDNRTRKEPRVNDRTGNTDDEDEYSRVDTGAESESENLEPDGRAQNNMSTSTTSQPQRLGSK